MTLRLAVVVSHPIQHFAPWHREVARRGDVELRVFFCCDWGVNEYYDPQFQISLSWDVPLLEGYDHEFLPIERRPRRLGFWEVDNPSVADALDRFRPDVVQVFGYAHRTNWRVVSWGRRKDVPVLLFSDSNAKADATLWRRAIKSVVVRRFYDRVDGALYCGDNNKSYHLRYGLPPGRLFAGGIPIDRERLIGSVEDRVATRRALRDRLGIPQDSFLVVMCGKYISHKRPIDLVVAAGELARAAAPVWAMLVGEGPDRPLLESYCLANRVTNVVLTGFVNQKVIADYYAASDVLAVPSQLDAHPLVVSEGASFGLPVVISDRVGCVGSSDTARPGVNAVVYPCGDTARLRAALLDLCSDRELYGRLSAASVAISEEQDVTVQAEALASAARQLREMGPRRAHSA